MNSDFTHNLPPASRPLAPRGQPHPSHAGHIVQEATRSLVYCANCNACASVAAHVPEQAERAAVALGWYRATAGWCCPQETLPKLPPPPRFSEAWWQAQAHRAGRRMRAMARTPNHALWSVLLIVVLFATGAWTWRNLDAASAAGRQTTLAPAPSATMGSQIAHQVTLAPTTTTSPTSTPTVLPALDHATLTIWCDPSMTACAVAHHTYIQHCTDTICGRPFCWTDADLSVPGGGKVPVGCSAIGPYKGMDFHQITAVGTWINVPNATQPLVCKVVDQQVP